MSHQSIEQRREYDKKYREANKEKLRAYHLESSKKRRKVPEFKIKLHPDADKVLKSLPNPFGSFEKARYAIFKDRSAVIPLYSFVTTCRNTEDCIEIMRDKFYEIYKNYKTVSPKYCSIFKIQNGIKKLIFRDIA